MSLPTEVALIVSSCAFFTWLVRRIERQRFQRNQKKILIRIAGPRKQVYFHSGYDLGAPYKPGVGLCGSFTAPAHPAAHHASARLPQPTASP